MPETPFNAGDFTNHKTPKASGETPWITEPGHGAASHRLLLGNTTSIAALGRKCQEAIEVIRA
jgi:hypothetical protein